MDGKALAERVRAEVRDEVAELGAVGLATILVGDNPASDVYVRGKHKAAGEAGLHSVDRRLSSETPQAEPLAHLLRGANSTVSICHSRTRDLPGETRRADVLVVAIGRPGLVTPDMVKPGAAVIDVGITRTDEGLRGDVAPEVAEVAGFLTP